MLVVVFKLLTANSTNYMVRAGTRLYYMAKLFFYQLLLEIFRVLFVQNCRIFVRELTLTLQLENAGAERRLQVCQRHIKFANLDISAEMLLKLRLLCYSILLKEVDLLGELILIGGVANASHESGKSPWFDTRYAKRYCVCTEQKVFFLFDRHL
jgi:hypothetical protein